MGVKNRKKPTTPRPPQVTEKQKFPEEKRWPRPVKAEKLYHKKTEADDDWQPSFGAVVKMLLSIRIASALWGVINDCDEVYNYWEPLHMMIYGNGFQTWEYSPDYGIRSYLYLFIHYIPGKLFANIFPDAKIVVFTLIRLCIGVFCLFGEYYAFTAICKKINVATGRFFIVFTICSSGIFVASTAFLPSSFAMTLGFYCLGAHLYEQWPLCVLCVAASTLVGWPFAAVLGFSVIIEMLLVKKIPGQFIKWSLFIGVSILGLVTAVDSHFFGKFVCAPFQIFAYNIGGPGPELYGVEPVTYYLKNLVLNWNVAALLAFGAAPLSFILYRIKNEMPAGTVTLWSLPTDFVWIEKYAPVFLYFYSAVLWILIFFTSPHKEERFLFPIYPHIAFLAAVTCDSFIRLFKAKMHLDFTKAVYGMLVVFAVLSASRGYAMFNNYGSHVDIYKALDDELNSHNNFKSFHNPIRVCVGKEWHRFPSSFFIPNEAVSQEQEERAVEFQFIRSEFRGILPKHFLKGKTLTEVTRHVPSNMNDQNREEEDRYVPLESCDYVVDMDMPASEREPDFRTMSKSWKPIVQLPFIDAAHSHHLFRAFYIPFLSPSRTSFTNYTLYRQNRS